MVRLDEQPLDATVVYVHPQSAPDSLNLHIVDHNGIVHSRTAVPLVQNDLPAPTTGYAKWPTAQIIKAVKPQSTGAPAVGSTESSLDASVVQSTPTISADTAQTSQTMAPAVAKQSDVVTYGFDVALQALKAGKAATRKGWNGSGMFVYMVPAASYLAQTGIAKKVFGENALVPYNAYMALKGVDGTVSTWVPSIRDCLAEDWEISN